MNVQDKARAVAGNFVKQKNCLWSKRPPKDDEHNWALICIDYRGADEVTKGRALRIELAMKPYTDDREDGGGPDVCRIERFSHWMVSWIDQVAIRVYDKETGKITPAFRRLAKFNFLSCWENS